MEEEPRGRVEFNSVATFDEFGKKVFTGLTFKQFWGIPNNGSLDEREEVE